MFDMTYQIEPPKHVAQGTAGHQRLLLARRNAGNPALVKADSSAKVPEGTRGLQVGDGQCLPFPVANPRSRAYVGWECVREPRLESTGACVIMMPSDAERPRVHHCERPASQDRPRLGKERLAWEWERVLSPQADKWTRKQGVVSSQRQRRRA